MKNYYEINASRYIQDTKDCNMSIQYNLFISRMSSKGKILDIGFGSGRDMYYFKKLGYEVEGLDPTESFINLLKDDFKVYHSYVEEFNFSADTYDGIWACSSLLHVERIKLKQVLKNCCKSLKKNGVMYMSFKYGDFEGQYKERYFNFMNEKLINIIAVDTGLTIEEILITSDVRPNRENERWLNVILKKL